LNQYRPNDYRERIGEVEHAEQRQRRERDEKPLEHHLGDLDVHRRSVVIPRKPTARVIGTMRAIPTTTNASRWGGGHLDGQPPGLGRVRERDAEH